MTDLNQGKANPPDQRCMVEGKNSTETRIEMKDHILYTTMCKYINQGKANPPDQRCMLESLINKNKN